jgi:hypothetical protein
MPFTAVLIALIASCFCAAEILQSRALKEPVFGVEFCMETLKISFIPPDGNATGLASIRGKEAYQDLMYSYFELCHRAHLEQVPPEMWEDDHDHATSCQPYADSSESMLNLVAYRHEVYPNETDVELLTGAINAVKRVATDVLADRYNITMPDRPLVALAAPNFMWTMTEPEFWDGVSDTENGTPYNYGRDDWHYGFALKISEAVLQAGFKLEPAEGTDDAIVSPRRLDHTFPIAPAGYAAFWNPDFPITATSSVDEHPPPSHGTQHEGPPAVVLELTNATLSLWAQQKGQVWSPWYTRPQLGTHIRFGDHPGYMYSPEDWIWSDIVSTVHKLQNLMSQQQQHPEGDEKPGLLHIYLTGDAWDADMVEAFRSHLRFHKLSNELEVVFRGEFATSDGAACAAREMLNTAVAGP